MALEKVRSRTTTSPVSDPTAVIADQLRRRGAQAKLMVGATNDPAEHEADRIARDVTMRLEALQGIDADDVEYPPTRIRRMSESSAVGAGGGDVEAGLEHEIQAARGSGAPLPRELRRNMEHGFGASLDHARVHTDAHADTLNRSLNARAFTIGSDMFFAANEYQPASREGQYLLAHELTHVVQQTGDAQRTIRRLPTWAWVKQQVGDPKTGKSVGGREKSKNYSAFGKALDEYNTAADTVIDPDPGVRTGQYLDLQAKLDAVHAAVVPYNKKHKSDARARMVTGIGNQAKPEKAVLTTRKRFFDSNPPQANQKWKDVLPTSMGTHLFDLAAEGTAGGQQQGGINTVTKYDLPGGFTGYNKQAENEVRAGTPEEGITQDLGIPANRPGMDKRALAMWRIDQLLNANVLTRTERTLEKKYGKFPGVVSEEVAAGEKFGTKANRPGEFYKTSQAKAADPAAKPDALSGDDPVLQRCLSKLTIIDALCGQVDRHPGNWFVQTDGAGHVVGVVGIDNDLAFPEQAKRKKGNRTLNNWEDVTDAYRAYPGVGVYFDWEMAEMVLALQPADLAAVVADLLPDAAVTVLLARLGSLQAQILQAKTAHRLLTPAQWGANVNPAGAGANKETGGYIKDIV